MNVIKTYRHLWKNHVFAMISVHLMLCSLLFTQAIIGSKPVVCKYKGEWYFPNFSFSKNQQNVLVEDLVQLSNYDFYKLSYDFVIWPVMSNDPKYMAPQHAWQSPVTKNDKNQIYYLGSYDLGRDVFSGCIYGLQKSLFLSLLTILISGILGILIGSVFSYQSLRYRSISLLTTALLIISIGLIAYTIILSISYPSIEFRSYLPLMMCIGFILIIAFYGADKRPAFSFSLDFISLRYIELMKSIPVILLLLLLLQVFRNPDTITLAWIISIVYIPVIAKYARVFTLSASNALYIDSLITMGMSGTQIYVKHILPRILTEVLPILAFGISNIILAEASLSFLGLGFAPDEISLGTIMYAARSNPSAWWVVVFPGLLVFWLVFSFNTLGSLYSKKAWIRDIQS